MNWKASPPAIETAAISIAALSLGSAVSFAVAQIGPSDAGPVVACCAGMIAAVSGWVLVGRVDRRAVAPAFIATSPLADEIYEDHVLLLDQIVEEPMLLDDPLPVLADDSRVVRLFAALPEEVDAAPPVLGPGEMIARIENFLGHSRPSSPEPEPVTTRAASDDASAALHSALADIRRSLRHA